MRGGSAVEWIVGWHDYRGDAGGGRLGRETNASLSMPLRPGWRATAKFAEYRADASGADVRKVWLQLEWAAPSAQ